MLLVQCGQAGQAEGVLGGELAQLRSHKLPLAAEARGRGGRRGTGWASRPAQQQGSRVGERME